MAADSGDWFMVRAGAVRGRWGEGQAIVSERGEPVGKADWVYDPDLDLHIPCCTRWAEIGAGRKCGNGPLVGDAVLTGDCGEHKNGSTPS